ncbi:NAD(P)/FAD-dependent oxidoreductase [Streptomyces iranensis]|uniref:FAD-binding monooxygenase n=1 Tax=Streptomyces iranensis TaxID=576784 RepID=A0A060ZJN7_9ACTN|nr:NAD(P)/FAD-dependent oxidoreductase [Streptomyces iranensis]MBP2060854.1 flavin-dependent dehydrogenase [Streptomyces iranensis]CDR06315.1 FAD-binding monooxygenase [Streptomyces iranensis]
MPNEEPLSEEWDVIVVGGGPAGASTAGLLAQRGHRVLVLEREKFPRYHIGESLITGCVGVLEELGVRERVEALGFVKKFGGSLVWGRDGRWQFKFTEGEPEFPNAYNVRRADFDALILTRARELGAEVREEVTVRKPLVEDERVVGVAYAERGGAECRVRARFVIDCSGQARVLGREMTQVEFHEDLRNVAVWSYFQNGLPLTGDEAGNIFIEHVPGGWFWYIPMYDSTHSVGYVTAAEDASATGLGLPELLETKLKESTHLRQMLENGTRVSAYRSARDWSYACDRMAGPGWMLAGDAAAFVDPLFSTGVTLAMLAAGAAAKAVDCVLCDPAREAAVGERYERSYREFLESILSFVRFFYNAGLDREEYYKYAQALVDPGKLFFPRKDFVTLISGLNSLRPIFDLDTDNLSSSVIA